MDESRNKGRKRSRNESQWKKNVNKKARNEGKCYVSNSGKIIPEKIFQPVSSCCKNECFKRIVVSEQEKNFSTFYCNNNNYDSQNMILSNSLKLRDPAKINPESRILRLVTWTYLLHTAEFVYEVCQKFLLSLYKISMKRIRTVQKKMLNHENLKDKRGQNINHNLKLTDEIKNLIILHCESLPHRQSHYSYESSSLNYFEDSRINMHNLYELFLDYYTAVTGKEDCPIGESTYIKFFNHHSGFSFNQPRTDVCNICFENEVTKASNKNVKLHKEKASAYYRKKKEMLSEEKILILEFDFAQNLSLPKLPVCDQFFRRLMWLYVSNVHVHNTDKSYMFILPEGFAKKGANTVCNLVLYVIIKEFRSGYHEKIILFSDACGGQNRNYTVLRFFASLSAHLKVSIEYLYPVRGHSFNQCDRNFGLYSQKKKFAERIETQEEYVKIIESARNPPFTVVQQTEYQLINYEKIFTGEVKNLKISKAFYIKFYTDGKVDIFEDYYEARRDSFEIKPIINFNTLDNISPPIVGLAKEKRKDVESLLRYVSPEKRSYFVDHFEKVGNKIEKIKVKKEKEENISTNKKVKKEEKDTKRAKKV